MSLWDLIVEGLPYIVSFWVVTGSIMLALKSKKALNTFSLAILALLVLAALPFLDSSGGPIGAVAVLGMLFAGSLTALVGLLPVYVFKLLRFRRRTTEQED